MSRERWHFDKDEAAKVGSCRKHDIARASAVAETFAPTKDEAMRDFARLLWRAFGGRSENDVSERAAQTLGVTTKTVRNWLACRNEAPLSVVYYVQFLAGVSAPVARRR